MALHHLSGAVDFTVLETMTGGLDEVTLEVLDLYAHQAQMWAPMLDENNEGCRDALHTLRGASAGIGAHRLAALCLEAEEQAPSMNTLLLERVISGLNQTLSDVAIYRHSLMIRSLKA